MLRFIWNRRLQDRLGRLQPCPLPRPLDLTQARRVLVFAPHPDDETLGCGGTLAQLARSAEVKVVLVTDGSGAGGLPAGADRVRQEEFRRALAVLGIHDTLLLLQPDGAFQATAELAREVRQLLDDYGPDWVLLPSPLDYHRDHVRSAAFLEPLCREVGSITHVLFYEIWAPLPATHVVDITDEAALKQAALAEHATAMACGDYARAIDGLNRYRGLYLGRGRLAEAFWVEERNGTSLFDRIQQLGLRLLERLNTP